MSVLKKERPLCFLPSRSTRRSCLFLESRSGAQINRKYSGLRLPMFDVVMLFCMIYFLLASKRNDHFVFSPYDPHDGVVCSWSHVQASNLLPPGSIIDGIVMMLTIVCFSRRLSFQRTVDCCQKFQPTFRVGLLPGGCVSQSLH